MINFLLLIIFEILRKHRKTCNDLFAMDMFFAFQSILLIFLLSFWELVFVWIWEQEIVWIYHKKSTPKAQLIILPYCLLNVCYVIIQMETNWEWIQMIFNNMICCFYPHIQSILKIFTYCKYNCIRNVSFIVLQCVRLLY